MRRMLALTSFIVKNGSGAIRELDCNPKWYIISSSNGVYGK
jgi:hypothetical protein